MSPDTGATIMFKLNDVNHVLTQPGADQTLSLIVKVDPTVVENQGQAQGWRIWLKNKLRELRAAHPESAALPDLIARADHFFTTVRPDCKAIAAYLTPRGEHVLRLQVPVTDNEGRFGRPAVGPLLWLLDEYEPYVVMLVDSEKTRFFVTQLGRAGPGGARFNEMHEYDFRRKNLMPTNAGEGYTMQGGNNRDAFAATLADHTRRYYREVAEQCAQLLHESGARRILLGGSEEAAHAIQGMMPEPVARAVIGLAQVPMHVSDQVAWETMLPRALEFEREHEQTLVDEVVNLAKSGGRGALGVRSVLECLRNKQVELLLVPWPLEDPELLVKLPELAMASSAEIELVAGPAAERVIEEGGLAARLYYATPERTQPPMQIPGL